MQAILLSLIIISPLWLQLSMLKIEQEICKHQSKKHIFSLKESASELVSFSFSQSEFENIEWEEKGEFAYKGQMFDVVKQEISGKDIKLLCWPDKKEGCIREKIQTLFAQKWQQNSTKRQRHYTHLEQLLKTYIFQSNSSYTFLNQRVPKLKIEELITKTRIPFFKIALPPPRFF